MSLSLCHAAAAVSKRWCRRVCYCAFRHLFKKSDPSKVKTSFKKLSHLVRFPRWPRRLEVEAVAVVWGPNQRPHWGQGRGVFFFPDLSGDLSLAPFPSSLLLSFSPLWGPDSTAAFQDLRLNLMLWESAMWILASQKTVTHQPGEKRGGMSSCGPGCWWGPSRAHCNTTLPAVHGEGRGAEPRPGGENVTSPNALRPCRPPCLLQMVGSLWSSSVAGLADGQVGQDRPWSSSSLKALPLLSLYLSSIVQVLEFACDVICG